MCIYAQIFLAAFGGVMALGAWIAFISARKWNAKVRTLDDLFDAASRMESWSDRMEAMDSIKSICSRAGVSYKYIVMRHFERVLSETGRDSGKA